MTSYNTTYNPKSGMMTTSYDASHPECIDHTSIIQKLLHVDLCAIRIVDIPQKKRPGLYILRVIAEYLPRNEEQDSFLLDDYTPFVEGNTANSSIIVLPKKIIDVLRRYI